MKMKLTLILAAGLALAACEKKAEPAAEAPATEQPVEEAKPTEEAKPAEGAAEGAAAADKPAEEATVATVGKPAPEFELADASGKTHKLSDYKGKIVVLEWTSPECPVVKRVYEAKTMQTAVEKLGAEVVWLSVDSSHFVTPEATKKWKEENKFDWPYLQDPEGKVGQQYGAKTTPHMYVVDKEGVLRYSGAIDDDPHGKKAAEERNNYVVEAVTAIAEGKDVPNPETKPYGCSVKYKS